MASEIVAGEELTKFKFSGEVGHSGIRIFSEVVVPSWHQIGKVPLSTGCYLKGAFRHSSQPVLPECPVAQLYPLAHEFTHTSITAGQGLWESECWPVYEMRTIKPEVIWGQACGFGQPFVIWNWAGEHKHRRQWVKLTNYTQLWPEQDRGSSRTNVCLETGPPPARPGAVRPVQT